MRRILETSLPEAEFRLTDPSGQPVLGVEIQVFRNGGVRTVAIQSNPGPPDTASTKLFEGSRSVVLTLPREQFVYDVRTARTIGKQKQLTVRLDPYEPSIFTTSSAAIPPPKISGPRRLRPGQTGTFVLTTGRLLPHSISSIWMWSIPRGGSSRTTPAISRRPMAGRPQRCPWPQMTTLAGGRFA
jgi:hypothetical protein